MRYNYPMQVEILQLANGAKQAKGTVIIIDVFRAFTLEAYLFAQGCNEIQAVYDLDKALQIHKAHPSYLLFGERNGKILPGFDYGNSPSSIYQKDFTNQIVIHSTTNGTLGIKNAIHADDIYVGSLVNAKATVTTICKKKPKHVSIVCMGWIDRETEEDTLCAKYMKSLFEEKPIQNIQQLADELRYTEGKKFFDASQQDVFPIADFKLCTTVDCFSFAIHTTMKDGIAYNRKEL